MEQDRITKLPGEILTRVVEYLRPDPETLVPVYYRRFLSVESLEIPRPSDDQNINRDVKRFRQVCKRFAEVSEPVLFTVIRTRFSERELLRLEEFVGLKKNLARHVKRFSYLVGCFYNEGEQFLGPRQGHGISQEKIVKFRERLEEQRQIQTSGIDVRILAAALKSFTSLQVVKLLRVSDHWDAEFRDYIRRQEGLEHWTERYWAPSCTYGSFTIGKALISANVDLSRYYVPAMHVGTLSQLHPSPPASLSKLAACLTCLTLVFDDGHDLDERISDLSPLFRKVFAAAENMQAIHIGFPRYRPFNHPLENVFHDVTWNKLLAFGVSGWCLRSDEIINLAVRHREKLKGLRLRDVFLKEGSRWKEVLWALKFKMESLEWLSLRQIGYDEADIFMNGGGAEVPDDTHLSSSSESDDENDNDDDMAEPGSSQHQANGHLDAQNDAEDYQSSEDGDNGPGANDTEFPAAVLTPSDPTIGKTPNGIYQMALDMDIDLEDNGVTISREQRKAWEAWVVKHRQRTLVT